MTGAEREKLKNYLQTIEALVHKCYAIIGEGSANVRVTANTSKAVRVSVNGKEISTSQPRGTPYVTPNNQSPDLAKRILEDPRWPEAIYSDLLCEPTDDDLLIRADAILDQMLDRDIRNLRFLDFGCGLGDVARQAIHRGASEAVGYDIKREGWERFRGIPGLSFYDSKEDLKSESFDVILAYDVLDHCQKPVEAATFIHSLLAPDGVAYVRCHPWCSRTGGHLYRSINKAYIHLALDEVILRRMGHEPEPIKKVLRPLKTYQEWFSQAGLIVKRENPKNEPIEKSLLDIVEFRNAIFRNWDHERTRDRMLNDHIIQQILEIHFVDYVLQRGTS